MGQIIRLVYASKVNFPENTGAGVELQVGRILRESRRRNDADGIGGVLYCGNGYFFQCLEGPSEAVANTYSRIQSDRRHSDVKLLLHEPVETLLFKNWSMKFVSAVAAIDAFVKQQGIGEFNPYRFDENSVKQLLSFLQAGRDQKLPVPSRWWQRLFGLSRRANTTA
ncbi:BLUF domain-containing protein [Simiduia aestuariiviva]|uniref:BLUF domain-containing protein n=1 Tax=Simiduia aestuariiviva TaxID=1510459 RepID=A0A839UTK8_9GAMM|nr:BLUF domain-containing protein [Simiduia aestuariiviva]MBB3168838.1 hypothetical protein [Simiduia aestuariiviva]